MSDLRVATGWLLLAILASYLADRYLPTREQFGRGLQKAIKTYGEQPYFGML